MPGPLPRKFIPYSGNGSKSSLLRRAAPYVGGTLLVGVVIFSLPSVLALDVRSKEKVATTQNAFPVTVDPASKTINEDPAVNAQIDGTHPGLTAAVGEATDIFAWLASAIASLPAYQQLAGSDIQFVTLYPGYRKEEVAAAFGSSLGWSYATQQRFLKQVSTTDPILTEGEFVPGTYIVSAAASPTYVHTLLTDRFTQDVLSRYSSTTAERVPVSQALTIASMLEREAGGPSDMRIISGIIWNRIFKGMNLQIDATLQYAKASNVATASWWPPVVPKDKYIKSPYNTYAHPGLPPAPIASPSVAAVIAALNPKKTDCIFYFHDRLGGFHCSKDYAQHVALLRKYYNGRGK